MADGVRLKVEGADQVINNLSRFRTKATKEIKMGMRKAVLKIKRNAKSLAPRDTGFLRSNIVGKTTTFSGGVRGIITSKAPYSIYQEFGTVNHDAHPYMLPAYNGNIKYIENQLRVSLVKAMIFSSNGAIGARI